jgi:hypothetical protein
MSKRNDAGDTASPRNLELWDAVERVDPQYVTEIKLGRRSFSTVDAYYQLRQATMIWGKYGEAWGMRNIKVDTHRITEIHRDGPAEVTKVLMTCEFFYPDGAFEIVNDLTWRGDDTLKKLTTNTRSKALSFLGFAASIYMGKHEDAAYRKDNETHFRDQNKVVKTITAKINLAQQNDQLDAYSDRIEGMIAERVVTPEVGHELTEVLQRRREEIAA